MKTVKIDGVSYEAEAPVISALHAITGKVDGLEGEKETLNTQLQDAVAAKDAAEGRADQAEADLKAAKEDAKDETALKAKVDARVELLLTAKDLVLDGITNDSTDLEIMSAAIEKADASVVLEGKSDAYIEGRYDAAVSALKKGDVAVPIPTHSKGDSHVDAQEAPKHADGSEMNAIELAAKANQDRMSNLWNSKEK